MIVLYHGGPSGHSASVLIALTAKGLEFEERRLDLTAFEQHEASFLKLNPAGQVPVLCENDRTLSEAFFILLYLDERYAEPPLGGVDARARYVVQKWGKYVETHIAPNLAIVGWAVREGDSPIPSRLSALAPERRSLWLQALAGFSDEDVGKARAALAKAADRIAEDLAEHDWLAGDRWSLADIIVFPHAARLAELGVVLPAAVADWLVRMNQQPAVRQALGVDGILPVVTMGPERGRWG